MGQRVEGGKREESRRRRRRGRAAAKEASVFPQERGCRAKSTWKSRGMGKWCSERQHRARARAPKPALTFTGLSSAESSSAAVIIIISCVRGDSVSSGLPTGFSKFMRRAQNPISPPPPPPQNLSGGCDVWSVVGRENKYINSLEIR